MIVTREEGSRPIKAWLGTKEVKLPSHEAMFDGETKKVIDVEDAALQQTKNITRLPFIAPQGVALMPDAHLGKGATVGSVVPTTNASIPSAVGAGRAMSRAEAKRRFSLTDLVEQTSGVECRKDAGVLDEIPGAYKRLDVVMELQKDLVEVVHVLKAVLCVKGN